MKVRVYYTSGVAGLDVDDASAPAQGLQVSFAVKETDWVNQGMPDEWASIPRTSSGAPTFGYKAKVVSVEDANVWANRIKKAGELFPSPYVDMEGSWYPGAIGAGLSVVDEDARNYLASREEAALEAASEAAKQAQTVTPRQARQWLIGNDLDEALEAGILAIGASGLPEDVKQSKLMWNWYEYSTEWQYKNEHLTAACAALGIDKDQFFAEAKLL